MNFNFSQIYLHSVLVGLSKCIVNNITLNFESVKISSNSLCTLLSRFQLESDKRDLENRLELADAEIDKLHEWKEQVLEEKNELEVRWICIQSVFKQDIDVKFHLFSLLKRTHENVVSAHKQVEVEKLRRENDSLQNAIDTFEVAFEYKDQEIGELEKQIEEFNQEMDDLAS